MKLRKFNIDSIIFDFRIQQEGLLCFPFPAVFFFHGCLMPFPAVAAVIWIMCQCIRKGKIVPAFPALPLDPPRCAGPLSGFLLLSKFFPAVLAVIGNMCPCRINRKHFSAVFAGFFGSLCRCFCLNRFLFFCSLFAAEQEFSDLFEQTQCRFPPIMISGRYCSHSSDAEFSDLFWIRL